MKRKMLASIAVIFILTGFLMVVLSYLLQGPELVVYYVKTEPIPIEEDIPIKEPKLEAKTIEAVEKTLIKRPGVNDADKALLAKIAKAEAGNQDVIGKALVIRVVINRIEADGFPDSIKEVIYEENQFTPVVEGSYDNMEPDEGCWEALDMVLDEGWDESQGALYFESDSDSTWHRDNLKYLFDYGNHHFYTDR